MATLGRGQFIGALEPGLPRGCQRQCLLLSIGISKKILIILLAISIGAIFVLERLISYPPPWPYLFVTLHMTIWLMTSVFLLCLTQLENKVNVRATRIHEQASVKG